ncbi:MAG: disulfide bond formation protein B [Amphritea sp.]
MLSTLNSISRSAWYWVAIIIIGLSMEGVALFYQYGLDYGPCVLCIHVRIWVMAFVLLATLALLVRNFRPLLITAHIISVIAAIGLLERSWMTFAVERNLLEGSCSMSSGLPDWFALDRWFPAVFEPWELCGYTPELLFGITMAEALLLMSVTTLVITIMITAASLRRQ